MKTVRWISFALLAWASFPISQAFIMSPLSIEALTDRSDVIVHGTVVSKSCQRDDEGRIYTQIKLRITSVWKGDVGSSPFTIFQGGGILGERKSVVTGQAEYRIGEEVVAFLVRNSRGEAVTIGLAQGKFHVWLEPITQTKHVNNPFHGVEEGSARLKSTDAGLSLGELKARTMERLQ